MGSAWMTTLTMFGITKPNTPWASIGKKNCTLAFGIGPHLRPIRFRNQSHLQQERRILHVSARTAAVRENVIASERGLETLPGAHAVTALANAMCVRVMASIVKRD